MKLKKSMSSRLCLVSLSLLLCQSGNSLEVENWGAIIGFISSLSLSLLMTREVITKKPLFHMHCPNVVCLK